MKNVGNNSHGRSQGVPKIFTAHDGALRGHLCDSTAFLFSIVSASQVISNCHELMIIVYRNS